MTADRAEHGVDVVGSARAKESHHEVNAPRTSSFMDFPSPSRWSAILAEDTDSVHPATYPSPSQEPPGLAQLGAVAWDSDASWREFVSWSPLRLTPSQEDTGGSNKQQAQSMTTSPRLPIPGISENWDKLPEYQLGLVSDGSDTYLVDQLPEGRSTRSSSDKASSHRTRSCTGSSPVKKSVTMKKAGESSQAKRKRRVFLADELQKVNAVRQESACIRCQILKEPCGEGCPCPKCLDVNATATIWRSPCFKGRISDVQIYRNRCMSFPDGLRRIDQWASTRKLKVQLYHVGFSGVNHAPETRPRIEIVVQNFVPVPEDVLYKKWVRGNEVITFDMPAYAIPSKQKKRTLQALEACFDVYWDVLVSELNLGQDELVSAALDEGKRIHAQSSLIHATLSICAITRLISKSFNLTGPETLGITEVDDPVSPYYGRIPIPMFLDTQLDELWETLMGKISKKLLSELKRKILARKKEDWYEVCLCLIILLANLELVYTAWLGQKSRYYHNASEASIPFSIRSTFKSWEHAADNILAHFRAVFNGNAPFFLDLEDEELRTEAKLDGEAIAYLKRTKEILRSREAELREKRETDPGDPLVWVSGLFVPPENAL